MIWLALAALVYVVLGLVFVLALCLSASRRRPGRIPLRRAVHSKPRGTRETGWEAEHGA